VWLPDIETQKSIADFLDHETSRIDSLIEKRDRFNQLLDEVEKSLVAETICGHLLTTEDRRDAGWLGTVPANWDMQRMRFLFRERLGRSDSGNEELLSISHLTGVTKRSEKDVNMFLAESNIGYKLVIPGDLVVNTMWAWMGAMGISSEEGIISPSYGVYRPTSQAISSDFADLVVRSPQFIAEATRRSKGIHSSRLRLYTDALYDIPFPVPPLEDQSKLIEELHRRRRRERALRSKNELAISLLKELRSSLVTATVTGQIDPATYRRKGTTDMTLDRIEKELST
jgi:type I restriction enzyme S subunit